MSDIKQNLYQSLGVVRAEELIKLWKLFDPLEDTFSFPKFSEKFMSCDELEKCRNWICAIETEMVQHQQVIDALGRIEQKLDQGINQNVSSLGNIEGNLDQIKNSVQGVKQMIQQDRLRQQRIEQGVQKLIRGQEFVSCSLI